MKIVLDESQIIEAVKEWLPKALRLQPTGDPGSIDWLHNGEPADNATEIMIEVTQVPDRRRKGSEPEEPAAS